MKLAYPGEPQARIASVALVADVGEDADRYAPMTSRILHLALIDVLAWHSRAARICWIISGTQNAYSLPKERAEMEVSSLHF